MATLPRPDALGAAVRCQRCPARVVWVKTEARGKSMPLDPDPHPEGNVVLVPLPQSRHWAARVLPPEQLPPADGAPAYLSHFVTCPGGRPKVAKERPTSDCQMCGWAVEGESKKAVRHAWAEHYAAEHLDRCRTCNARVVWIRAENESKEPGAIIMLDPTPVDAGDFVIVTGRTQPLARSMDSPDSLLDVRPGYQLHHCAPAEAVARG